MKKIVNSKTLQHNSEPFILAVETSGRTGSAALARGDELIAERQFSTLLPFPSGTPYGAGMAYAKPGLKHSSEVFPAMQELLTSAGIQPLDIEQIYISAGPGSFTGLRLTVTIAKIMQLANENIKIVAVDTLDCIASNIIDFQKQKKTEIQRVAAILDAKRGEFFTAVYKRRLDCKESCDFYDCWQKVALDSLLTAKQFIERFAKADEAVWLLGEGLVYYKKDFQAQGIEFVDDQFWLPKASKVFVLGRRLAKEGRFADPLVLVPNYLQRPDIKIRKDGVIHPLP